MTHIFLGSIGATILREALGPKPMMLRQSCGLGFRVRV